MTDIEKEYAAAVGNITAADLDKFEKLRVRREIAGGLLLRLPPVGKLTIQAFNDGSLQPHESGKAAYITPFLEGDDLLDLIAWRPGSKMFSRTGIASLIGGDAIAKARWNDESVFAFSNPLEWLRGDCRGVVPVRFDTDLAIALGSVDIVAQTPALARRIKAAFALPEPKISHMKLQEAAL